MFTRLIGYANWIHLKNILIINWSLILTLALAQLYYNTIISQNSSQQHDNNLNIFKSIDYYIKKSNYRNNIYLMHLNWCTHTHIHTIRVSNIYIQAIKFMNNFYYIIITLFSTRSMCKIQWYITYIHIHNSFINHNNLDVL